MSVYCSLTCNSTSANVPVIICCKELIRIHCQNFLFCWACLFLTLKTTAVKPVHLNIQIYTNTEWCSLNCHEMFRPLFWVLALLWWWFCCPSVALPLIALTLISFTFFPILSYLIFTFFKCVNELVMQIFVWKQACYNLPLWRTNKLNWINWILTFGKSLQNNLHSRSTNSLFCHLNMRIATSSYEYVNNNMTLVSQFNKVYTNIPYFFYKLNVTAAINEWLQ